MPKATKRERQRINRELRREAMRKVEQRRRRFRTARNLAIPIVIVAIIFGVLRLTQGDDDSTAGANGVTCADVKAGKGTDQQFANPPPMTIDSTQKYTAVMETSCGTITFALDASQSPVAVNNFVFLSKQKFYDGLDFPRVAKGFVIQAGSPDNTQEGGPGYSVQGEVPKVVEGQPAYAIGALAMAKGGAEVAGTAGSQFFVVTGSGNTGLAADYAYVGKVTKGLDVAKKIASLSPDSGDGPPTQTAAIKKVTIQTSDAATTTTAAP